MARGAVKLPWMPLYGNDWRTDRKLRSCAPETRAWWLDLLLVMWDEQVHTTSGTVLQLARMVGAQPSEMAAALLDLHRTGTANIAPPVKEIAQEGVTYTVTSRRIKRMLAAKSSGAKRVREHRERVSNADETPIAGLSNGTESESEERDIKNEDPLSRASAPAEQPADDLPPVPPPPPLGAWGVRDFGKAWTDATDKTAVGAYHLLQEATDYTLASAKRRGLDPVARLGQLVAAFKAQIAGWKANGRPTPQISIAKFVEHFERIEGVADGEINPQEKQPDTARPERPRMIGRAPEPVPAAGGDGEERVTWGKPEDIR